MTSKFLNISTDTTLGGSSASDNTVASQKAVKAYADTKQDAITSSNKLQASLVSGLATVATSGSYNDLSNKPTIPTVNNATITFTQGGTTKGTFTLNQSSDKVIALDAGSSSYTAGTGINIKNNVISVEGVKNQRNTSQAIKTWTGTLAQYNAIVTKDSNTLYNITDDNTAVAYQAYTKNEVDNLISAIYPVGSIYIGTQSTCPLATLISGSTWVKVSEGRVLQGSDSSHSAGTTIAAGLPNITGNIQGCVNSTSTFTNGVFSRTEAISAKISQQSSSFFYGSINFNASRSSSIYGNSTTVQPPAFVVNIWQRTA